MSESKSGTGLHRRGYEEDVASDSSDLWLDESGESGADESAASGGLPVGWLGVVMWLAEEVE